MKKNLIAKSTSSYLVDTNIKYEEDRFSNLMTGINRFLTAMRMNGKRLTPKNYKLTKEVLEKLSNEKVKITEITPMKKHKEEYSKGSLITKAKMTIWFSEDILSLGSDEEIFRDVKKIVRKKSM